MEHGMRMMFYTVIYLMCILLSNGYAAEKLSNTVTPSPGLLVVNLTVKDKEKFALYAQKAKPILEAHKAVLYFKGVNPQSLFGANKHHVLICFKFPSKEAIKNFYTSKDYQSLIPLRTEAADVLFTAYDIIHEESPVDMHSLLAVNILIKDKEKFDNYGKSAGSIVKANGGQLQLRASNPEVLFGENPYKVLVLFKFPDKETMKTFYHSKAYQKIIPLRTEGADVIMTSYDL
jgi:uncharacterized protein (DUF1330 family)